MKILVCGSRGFLGQNIIKKLSVDNVYDVYQFNRENLDLSNISKLENVMSKLCPDVIVNCAAHVGSVHYVNKFAADVLMDNTQFSINIYKSLLLTKNFNTLVINPISNCCYPENPGINYEGCWSNGDLHESIEGYGAYKRHLIHLSRCMFRQYDIRTINCMFPGIFGPGDSVDPNKAHALNGMISRAIQMLPNETKFLVWGTGSPVRDWLFVEDAVNAMIELMKKDISSNPNPINVTAQNHIKMNMLAEIILKFLDKDVKIEFDISKQDGVLKKVLAPGSFNDFCPNFMFSSFEYAVSETIKYYKEILK